MCIYAKEMNTGHHYKPCSVDTYVCKCKQVLQTGPELPFLISCSVNPLIRTSHTGTELLWFTNNTRSSLTCMRRTFHSSPAHHRLNESMVLLWSSDTQELKSAKMFLQGKRDVSTDVVKHIKKSGLRKCFKCI